MASKRRGGSGSTSATAAETASDRGPRSSKSGSGGGRVRDKQQKDGKDGPVKKRVSSKVALSESAKRKRAIDPTLLARGMSGRSVGLRISSNIKILSIDEIDRDLRHMEAYRAACVAYAQQLYVYNNRTYGGNGADSGQLGSGVYYKSGDGYVAQQPDATANGRYPSGAAGVIHGRGGAYPMRGEGSQHHHGSHHHRHHHHQPHHHPQFTMPVRIDPEEEKRVALLRKRIAASEAQREVWETEYMSLRAQYVHMSKKLRRTRNAVDSQLEFLRELVKRRGMVLALRRSRLAMARDVLWSLQQLSQSSSSSSSFQQDSFKQDGEKSSVNRNEKHDIIDVWNSLENQLEKAEKACISVDVPPPIVDKEKENSNNSNDTEEASGGSNTNGTKSGAAKKKPRSAKDEEKSGRILPWESQCLARTPRGIPILLSLMSEVPDRTAAFGCGGVFGSEQTALCWLEPNLPKSTNIMEKERERMLFLREQERCLLKELEYERRTNKDLQTKIIESRKRGDGMCAMMSMLRTETEAVLMRHNIVLDTPEAQSKTQILHTTRGADDDEDNESAAVVAGQEVEEELEEEEEEVEAEEEDELGYEGEDGGEAQEEEEEEEEEEQRSLVNEETAATATAIASNKEQSGTSNSEATEEPRRSTDDGALTGKEGRRRQQQEDVVEDGIIHDGGGNDADVPTSTLDDVSNDGVNNDGAKKPLNEVVMKNNNNSKYEGERLGDDDLDEGEIKEEAYGDDEVERDGDGWAGTAVEEEVRVGKDVQEEKRQHTQHVGGKRELPQSNHHEGGGGGGGSGGKKRRKVAVTRAVTS